METKSRLNKSQSMYLNLLLHGRPAGLEVFKRMRYVLNKVND